MASRNSLSKTKGSLKLEVNDIIYFKKGIYPINETSLKRKTINKLYPKIKPHIGRVLDLDFINKEIVEFEIELEFLEKNKDNIRNVPYKKTPQLLKMALNEESMFAPELFEGSLVLHVNRDGPYTVIAIGSFNKRNKGMNVTTSKYGIFNNKVKQFGFFVLIAEYKTQIYSWMPGCLIEQIKKKQEHD